MIKDVSDAMIVWEALQQFVDNSEDCVDNDLVLAAKVERAQEMIVELTIRFTSQMDNNDSR